MDKKIRILFTIPNFKTAGSQYVVLSILRNLDVNKFDVYVGVEKFPECIPEDIPKNRRVNIGLNEHLIDNVRSFRKVLKNNKIDLVHSWDYKSNYSEAIACRVTGVPYLFTKKNNSWSKRWLLKSILSKHVAYDNPQMRQRFFNMLHFKSKITFIPHGVDISKFKPLPKIAQTTFNLCCIGNINPNKNQVLILNALTLLPENVHLNLYGKEEMLYKNELTKYIKAHDLTERVHFHGYVKNEDVPQVFNKQDVFVLASKNEGFPVCLLEAMACGVPVLSSNSGGGAAYLLAKNKGGYVFDVNNVIELSRKIKCFMTNKDVYENSKVAALENVRTHFSLTKEIEAYNSLYLKLSKI